MFHLVTKHCTAVQDNVFMKKNKVGIKFPNIAKQIIEMVRKDQEMRLGKKGNIEIDLAIDLIHLARIKSIVDQIGWPSISLVGEEASDGAWLLVQHADSDVLFQEKSLKMMKKLSEDELNKKNIAYLEDRVRTNKSQPQIYGTQFELSTSGELIPKPINDSKNIDERRKSMGLNSMTEYIKELKQYLTK